MPFLQSARKKRYRRQRCRLQLYLFHPDIQFKTKAYAATPLATLKAVAKLDY